MKRAAIIIGSIPLLFCTMSATGGVVWYLNDYAGWAAAAGEVFEINFNTLPDGSPSVAGTPITPDFNYTSQGVTFSGPLDSPFIIGNTTTGFALAVDSSPSIQMNWIIGEEEEPAHALGIRFPSSTDFSIFDVEGDLIDTRHYYEPGLPFLGVLSDIPIENFTVDRNSSFAVLGSYYRGTVPEPASLMLCGAAVLMLIVRKAHPH